MKFGPGNRQIRELTPLVYHIGLLFRVSVKFTSLYTTIHLKSRDVNFSLTNSGVVAVDFCCSRLRSLAMVVAKSVGSSYTGDILSSSNSRSASSDILPPQRPRCSVERPSRYRVDLSGVAVGSALFSSSFPTVVDELDLGMVFGNCCGITAAVAEVMPSLSAAVTIPWKRGSVQRTIVNANRHALQRPLIGTYIYINVLFCRNSGDFFRRNFQQF